MADVTWAEAFPTRRKKQWRDLTVILKTMKSLTSKSAEDFVGQAADQGTIELA